MSKKFKAGDQVRVLRHRNFYGEDVPNYGIERGSVVTLCERDDSMVGGGFETFAVEDLGDGFRWLIRTDDIELANPSPVRTVSRREIVPGTYGIVRVFEDETVHVACARKHTPAELRDAARIFTEIADALEEGGA